MNDRLRRIAAIVTADVKIRFRRTSTLVVFLLMTAAAYAWVPSPSTGRALLQIDGRRCLYNSAAIGMGTASLSTIMIGLFGFYVISNAISRDARSRCGFVIASTNVRSTEYLAGKFAGNILFLATFMSGFMVSAMAMLIVRGEARLEPLVFMKQYALLVPVTIVSVSAIAIVFESIPFLSGRFGDVAYFFFWTFAMTIAAISLDKGAPIGIAGAFDFSGLGFVLDQAHKTLHTTAMSIGASDFDPRKPVFIYSGLHWDSAWLVPRLISMLLPVPLLAIARAAFHRFDPVRVKQGAATHGTSWWARINRLLRFARVPIIVPGAKPSLLRSAIADAMLTLNATPAIVVTIVATSVAALASPSIRTVLMVIYPAIAISIADIASRESRAGTMTMVSAAPLVRPRFVAWKMLASTIIASLFLFVPLLRGANVIATVAGALFVCASATFLGIVSGNPKTFIVLFLSYWYLAVNDKGATPSLDFAGFNGAATARVSITYAVIALVVLIAAQMKTFLEERTASGRETLKQRG